MTLRALCYAMLCAMSRMSSSHTRRRFGRAPTEAQRHFGARSGADYADADPRYLVGEAFATFLLAAVGRSEDALLAAIAQVVSV